MVFNSFYGGFEVALSAAIGPIGVSRLASPSPGHRLLRFGGRAQVFSADLGRSRAAA